MKEAYCQNQALRAALTPAASVSAWLLTPISRPWTSEAFERQVQQENTCHGGGPHEVSEGRGRLEEDLVAGSWSYSMES